MAACAMSGPGSPGARELSHITSSHSSRFKKRIHLLTPQNTLVQAFSRPISGDLAHILRWIVLHFELERLWVGISSQFFQAGKAGDK